MAEEPSSPMTPPFMVSAPGKVIVFGEHAAVYGQPVIAAAISLRSYLLATTPPKSQRTVQLNFWDIDLAHTWDIESMPWDIFQQHYQNHAPVTSLNSDLLDAIRPYAEAVSKNLDDSKRKVHVRSARAFLYLFLSLGSRDSPGVIYTLRSTIPIGAGLGSSASVCVCLSAALLLQTRAVAGPHPEQSQEDAELQVEKINLWAFVGELCTHGEPSGVDNTVSAGGKAVVFRRNQTEETVVKPLPNFPKLPLLLVDTRVPRSTAEQVDKVRTLMKKYRSATTSILDGIGKLTTSALHYISSDSFTDSNVEDLGTLMRMNHGCLVSLGVSHPHLERVCELVDYADIGWAKLTGAGGGGCATVLFRPQVTEETIEEPEQKFAAEGFQSYKTVLGAYGVGVLWPAVSQNTTGECSEENDQTTFENAMGTEGIEKLVGVGVQEDRKGWKFWK